MAISRHLVTNRTNIFSPPRVRGSRRRCLLSLHPLTETSSKLFSAKYACLDWAGIRLSATVQYNRLSLPVVFYGFYPFLLATLVHLMMHT